MADGDESSIPKACRNENLLPHFGNKLRAIHMIVAPSGSYKRGNSLQIPQVPLSDFHRHWKRCANWMKWKCQEAAQVRILLEKLKVRYSSEAFQEQWINHKHIKNKPPNTIKLYFKGA